MSAHMYIYVQTNIRIDLFYLLLFFLFHSFFFISSIGFINFIMIFHDIFSYLLFISLLSFPNNYYPRLRMSSTRVRHTLIKLKLLELGNIAEYELFDDLTTVPVVFDDIENTHASDLEKKLIEYEKQYLKMMIRNNEIKKQNENKSFIYHKKIIKQTDASIKVIQRGVIDTFLKTSVAIKKCENCGSFSPGFRKDGFAKIFQKAMPVRLAKQMKAMRKKLQVTSLTDQEYVIFIVLFTRLE